MRESVDMSELEWKSPAEEGPRYLGTRRIRERDNWLWRCSQAPSALTLHSGAIAPVLRLQRFIIDAIAHRKVGEFPSLGKVIVHTQMRMIPGSCQDLDETREKGERCICNVFAMTLNLHYFDAKTASASASVDRLVDSKWSHKRIKNHLSPIN